MSRYSNIVKFDNKEGKAASKGSQRYIQWLKDKEALYEVPKHYDLLDEEYDCLWKAFKNLDNDFDNLEKTYAALQTENQRLQLKIQDLENEKKKQKRSYEILEQNYEAQKQEYEKLSQQHQAMVKKNQEATANNPKTAGGDSKRSYVQWIQEYIGLLGDYDVQVLDVVSNTPETTDALCRLVKDILDSGFIGSLDQAAQLQRAKERVYQLADAYLLPEYRDPKTRDYQEFHRFFEKTLDLARSAERYRESFYLVTDVVEVRFDTKYARRLGAVKPRNQNDNGKKITRCYLPAVLFFFDVDNAAACAPALVELEKTPNGGDARPPKDEKNDGYGIYSYNTSSR